MEQILTDDLKVKKERNSAFELLRIFAMFFIVLDHFSVHGGFDFSVLGTSTISTVNKTWLDFISPLGNLSVDLFILISAYFLADNNKFKIRKVLSLIIEMLFFSTVIGIAFIFISGKTVNYDLIKSIIFPIGSSTWWFMTAYLILYIFSPFLNLGIKAMNKKMHAILIIILVVVWSILSTIFDLRYGISDFGLFVTLYLIAAYIKIYDVLIKLRPSIGILLSIGIFVLWFSVKTVMTKLLGSDNTFVIRTSSWFNFSKTNIVSLIVVLILFLSFKKIQMKNIKFINVIASATFAVYLLHDHPDMRQFLWIDVFKNATYAESSLLIPYSIGVSLCVFIAGIIIGLTYKYSIRIGVNKLLDKFDNRCLYKIDEAFNSNKSEVLSER